MTEFSQLPLVLRPSRTKYALLTVACLGLTAIGVLMIRDGETNGYFCGGLFALCAFVFILNMLPNAAYLRLEKDGFTFSSLFRVHTVYWADIQEFGLISIRRKKMVAWNYVSGYTASERARRLSKALSGFEASLPDTYGLKAAVLAGTMEALWRGCDRSGLSAMVLNGEIQRDFDTAQKISSNPLPGERRG